MLIGCPNCVDDLLKCSGPHLSKLNDKEFHSILGNFKLNNNSKEWEFFPQNNVKLDSPALLDIMNTLSILNN